MNIVFAASEAAPFAKTGGLGDVAGSLPQALAALGHEVSLFLPRYRRIDPEVLGLTDLGSFYVPLGGWKERCEVLMGRLGAGVMVYFVNKDIYFDRAELYGTGRADYADNAERFIFFSRAVPELCTVLGLRPQVIHCNDWQTGLVPLFLRKWYAGDGPLARTRTVFSIHNLGYQGHFRREDLHLTGLGWDVFTPEGIEFWGQINLLKAGIVYADAVTTVSPTYSREILTPEYGSGLDGVLATRRGDLFGILNGIDPSQWNPAQDALLPHPYSAARPAGKRACSAALLARLGLPDSGEPLIGMVTRLADQKGLDILTAALPAILPLGVRLVILGTGEEKYHTLLREAVKGYADRLRVLFTYDEELARAIYAGADLFLMPSRYEPCGLSQMIALRYGAVPIVRKTGGLADTVVDYQERTGRGTGFVFTEYSPAALATCIRRALTVLRNRPAWRRLMEAGMQQDLSWEHSAKEYVKVYRKAMRRP